MTIRKMAGSAAVLLLLAGCAAGAADQGLDDLRKEVSEAKEASLAAQRAAEAAQQAAERAARDAATASARAEAVYGRSLRKGQAPAPQAQ